ncbi:hypothetical protein [Nocardia farcinica]|uniref:hypothetical protein n=1 Tax=Nocardia farcinica TaxID=37329 RepID=UPI002457BDEF|nr:hypothetical protein [Nocardia farcinica]
MQLIPLLSMPRAAEVRSKPPVDRIQTESWETQIGVLAQILAHHTGTPDVCHFAWWEGNSAFDGIRDRVPKIVINGLRYLVLRGPVQRATEPFYGLAPVMWWPSDRQWFVCSPSDFPCTYVGASEAAVDRILNAAALEALAARPDDPVSGDSDTEN